MSIVSSFRAHSTEVDPTSTGGGTIAYHLRRGPAGRADGRWEQSAATTLRNAQERASHSESEPGPADGTPLWRRVVSWAFTVLVVAMTIFLWPASLGGSTRLVIVSGTSMEPTYDLGDMVITRDRDTSAVGDAVVFEIPDGTSAGSLVIHRIIEVDEDGYFITQGDNRDTADVWPLTEENVVGQPLLHIPKGGLFVRFLQQLWVIAILVGLLVMFLMWPTGDDEPDDDEIEEAIVAGPVRSIDDVPAVTRVSTPAEVERRQATEPETAAPDVRGLEVVAVDDTEPIEFGEDDPFAFDIADPIEFGEDDPFAFDLTGPINCSDVRHDVDEEDDVDLDDVLSTDAWSETEIDQAVMDEAIEWLEAQLADAASTPAV